MMHRVHIGFDTYTHSGTFLPIYSIGVGAEYFGGNLDNTDNTDIPKLIIGIID